MTKLDVLVVGAMGRQGSAVVRALLQGGHCVRALTSSLAHPQADALRQRGARLAWAGPADMARLADAAAGVDAMFIATTTSSDDPAAELRSGLAMVDVARQHAVRHVVASSLAAVADPAAVWRLDLKRQLEAALAESGLDHTVLCPGFYMDDLARDPWFDWIGEGRLPLPLPEDRKLQQTTHGDFARFVRLVFERRDEFVGRRLCVASDELTPVEMAATLARVIGRPVMHEVAESSTLPVLQRLPLNSDADVVALRDAYPEVNWHTLDGWAKRQAWTGAAARA